MTSSSREQMAALNYPEIEDQLRSDLSRARTRFESALTYCRELRRGVGEGNLADGDQTLAEAERIAAQARKKFWRSLRRFSRFVLR